MKKKRIVFFIHSLPYGGAERLTVDLLNTLWKQGEDAYLITCRPSKETDMQSDCTLPAERQITVPVSGLFDIGGYVRLIRMLQKLQPDALITHLWFANTVGRVAGLYARVLKVISYEHNVYDSVKSPLQFFIDRLLASLSSRIVAVSKAVRESLIRHGIPSRKIVVIENGIDLSRFSGPRSNLGQNSLRAFSVLFAGRLTRQKGVDVLLKALALVPNTRLTIAGDGEEKTALQNLAQELRIKDRVSFLGIQKDLPNLMQYVDIFVLPSRWEGFGIVLLEAMASGVPVIASRVGGIPEIIENGISGLLVEPENPTVLADAITRFKNDTSLRERVQSSGLVRAKEFSIQKHADALLRIV